jgi:hypothetical protein
MFFLELILNLIVGAAIFIAIFLFFAVIGKVLLEIFSGFFDN